MGTDPLNYIEKKKMNNLNPLFKETKMGDIIHDADAVSFLELSDTPASYAGHAGKVPVITGGENGITFTRMTFLFLNDTPSDFSGSAGKPLVVNAGGTGIEFTDSVTLSEFILLNDTPASFAGEAGKVLKVNPGEDAIIFDDDIYVDTFLALTDTPSAFAGNANRVLKVNPAADAIIFSDNTFLLLSDVPSSYAGQTGKVLKVNAGATALEFSDDIDTDTFEGLTDTPASFTGHAGEVLKVNALANALEFMTFNFLNLNDTPAAYVANQYPRVNPTGDGIVFEEIPFLNLNDTPAAYTGHANKVVRVNAGESALEFYTLSLVTDFLGLSDTPSSYSGNANKTVKVNSAGDGLEFADDIDTVVDTFLGLTDTPSSFSGQAGLFAKVNAGADALEFANGVENFSFTAGEDIDQGEVFEIVAGTADTINNMYSTVYYSQIAYDSYEDVLVALMNINNTWYLKTFNKTTLAEINSGTISQSNGTMDASYYIDFTITANKYIIVTLDFDTDYQCLVMESNKALTTLTDQVYLWQNAAYDYVNEVYGVCSDSSNNVYVLMNCYDDTSGYDTTRIVKCADSDMSTMTADFVYSVDSMWAVSSIIYDSTANKLFYTDRYTTGGAFMAHRIDTGLTGVEAEIALDTGFSTNRNVGLFYDSVNSQLIALKPNYSSTSYKVWRIDNTDFDNTEVSSEHSIAGESQTTTTRMCDVFHDTTNSEFFLCMYVEEGSGYSFRYDKMSDTFSGGASPTTEYYLADSSGYTTSYTFNFALVGSSLYSMLIKDTPYSIDLIATDTSFTGADEAFLLTDSDVEGKEIFLAKKDATTGNPVYAAYEGEEVSLSLSGERDDYVYLNNGQLSLSVDSALEAYQQVPFAIVKESDTIIWKGRNFTFNLGKAENYVYDVMIGADGKYADLESAVAAEPAGTSFFVQPGTYSMTQKLELRAGDSWACLPGTVTLDWGSFAGADLIDTIGDRSNTLFYGFNITHDSTYKYVRLSGITSQYWLGDCEKVIFTFGEYTNGCTGSEIFIYKAMAIYDGDIGNCKIWIYSAGVWDNVSASRSEIYINSLRRASGVWGASTYPNGEYALNIYDVNGNADYTPEYMHIGSIYTNATLDWAVRYGSGYNTTDRFKLVIDYFYTQFSPTDVDILFCGCKNCEVIIGRYVSSLDKIRIQGLSTALETNEFILRSPVIGEIEFDGTHVNGQVYLDSFDGGDDLTVDTGTHTCEIWGKMPASSNIEVGIKGKADLAEADKSNFTVDWTDGTLIFNPTYDRYEWYDNTNSKWVPISNQDHKITTITATPDDVELVDDIILSNIATASVLNLPSASGISGRRYIIKNINVGTCTVTPDGSETIDGAASYALSSQYDVVTIVSDGTNWIII